MSGPPCPRCGLGVDSDGDGNCPICAHWSDAELKRRLDPKSLVGVKDLLLECSPVVISVRDQPLRRGVIGQVYPPTLFGVYVRGESSPLGRTKQGTSEVINQEWLALDLTHETGRSHAARYIYKYGPKSLHMPDYLVVYSAALFELCDVVRLRELVLMVDDSRWVKASK